MYICKQLAHWCMWYEFTCGLLLLCNLLQFIFCCNISNLLQHYSMWLDIWLTNPDWTFASISCKYSLASYHVAQLLMFCSFPSWFGQDRHADWLLPDETLPIHCSWNHRLDPYLQTWLHHWTPTALPRRVSSIEGLLMNFVRISSQELENYFLNRDILEFEVL